MLETIFVTKTAFDLFVELQKSPNILEHKLYYLEDQIVEEYYSLRGKIILSDLFSDDCTYEAIQELIKKNAILPVIRTKLDDFHVVRKFKVTSSNVQIVQN